jgi:hypothetical protein
LNIGRDMSRKFSLRRVPFNHNALVCNLPSANENSERVNHTPTTQIMEQRVSKTVNGLTITTEAEFEDLLDALDHNRAREIGFGEWAKSTLLGFNEPQYISRFKDLDPTKRYRTVQVGIKFDEAIYMYSNLLVLAVVFTGAGVLCMGVADVIEAIGKLF